MAERPLIFLHIPKTAGTSFLDVLKRVYPTDGVYEIYGEISDRIEKLQALPELERRKINCLSGHYKFGLHEDLPGSATYVTFLRDPVERVISHYYYVRRFPGHRLNSAITEDGVSLRGYVDLDPELSNGQVRMIADGEDDTPQDELLEQALQNLQNRFPVIGITERFDTSVTVMSHCFDWPSASVYYWKRNVSSSRPSVQEIDPDVRQYIESKNQVDRALYERASEWLDEHVEKMGADFRLQLWRMRVISRVYSKYRSTRSGIGRLVQPLLSALG